MKRRIGTVPIIPEVPPPPPPKINSQPGLEEDLEENHKVSLKEYLASILYMPHSLRMVCLTNLFCWMAHVCYSLYFTDFVGEAVYGGDPQVRFLFRKEN